MADLDRFEQRLKMDLEHFDKSIESSRRMHESFVREAKANNDPSYLQRAMDKLEMLEKQWTAERQKIIEKNSDWKKYCEERDRDFEFLCGRGLFFASAEMSFKQAKIFNSHLPIPIIGYVEIGQWYNQGLKSGETKFMDLFADSSRQFNWWRRIANSENYIRTKASPGTYLYGVELGGVLRLIDFQPDSSD